jgi:hypothetical protein
MVAPRKDGMAERDAEILRLVAADRTNGEIGAALGMGDKNVAQRLFLMRKRGIDVPPRNRGVNIEKLRAAYAARMAEPDPDLSQPVTVTRSAHGGVVMTRFASVALWRQDRPAGQSVFVRTRPTLKGLGLVRPISGGVQSPWLDVIPPLADGAPMSFTAPPVTSGCGSPAAAVAGVM